MHAPPMCKHRGGGGCFRLSSLAATTQCFVARLISRVHSCYNQWCAGRIKGGDGTLDKYIGAHGAPITSLIHLLYKGMRGFFLGEKNLVSKNFTKQMLWNRFHFCCKSYETFLLSQQFLTTSARCADMGGGDLRNFLQFLIGYFKDSYEISPVQYFGLVIAL